MGNHKWIAALLSALLALPVLPALAEEPEAEPVPVEAVEMTEKIQPVEAEEAVIPLAQDVADMSYDELEQAINGTTTYASLNALIDQMTEDQYQYALSNYLFDSTKYKNNFTGQNAYSGISDEQFYGKWNETTGAWENKPYIDYSYTNEDFMENGSARPLAAMEQAVKEGDYDLAKEEWLNYRREAESFKKRPAAGDASFAEKTSLTLLDHNFIWNPNSNAKINGTLSVGNEPRWTDIDLEDSMSYILSATDKAVAFYLTGLTKDGARAEFDSINKEGGNKPYLEVVENGMSKRFYPTNDATIKAESLKTVNASGRPKHGLEDTLSVYESPDTINTNRIRVDDCNCDPQPVNEDTSRSLLMFELGDQVDANNNITSMTLHLYGKNAGGTGEMEVVSIVTRETAWEESTVDWWFGTDLQSTTDPDKTNGKHFVMSFDGDQFLRYDKPDTTTRRFRDEFMRFTGHFDYYVKAYRRGGSRAEEYGGRAVREMYYYLLQMAAKDVKNDEYGGTRHAKNRLDMSFRPNLATWSHELINSDEMNEDYYSVLSKYMYRVGDILSHNVTSGNWGGYEMNGAYRLSLEMPEFYAAAGWGQLAIDNLVNDISAGYVQPDLACGETPLQYASVARSTLTSLDSIAQEAGYEKAEYPEVINERLHNISRYILYSSGPGGRDHQQGDAAGNSRSYYSGLKTDAIDYQDDELLYAATGGQKGHAPAFTSIPFETSKKFVMRSSWKDDARYLLINADGAESHQHNDDLAISMFAYGEYLLADGAYNGNNYGQEANAWMTSTQGHSTLIADRKDQAANTKSTGVFNEWGSNGTYDFVSLTTKAYQSTAQVTPTRNVLFVKPDFWIVTDYVVPTNQTAKHTYEQRWLMMPNAKPTVNPVTKEIQTHFEGANLQIVPVEAERIKGYATSDEFLEDGYIGGGTGVTMNTKYVDYEQADVTGNAAFNTILYPTEKNKSYDIKTEALPMDVENNAASAFRMEARDKKTGTVSEAEYYLLNDKSQKAPRTFGDYTYNGRLAYVGKENSKLTDIIVRDYKGAENGLELKDDFEGKTLLKSSKPIEGLSVRYSGSTVSIESNVDISNDTKKEVSIRDIDLSDVTLYAPERISVVNLNGNSVPFAQRGDQLYFDGSASDPEPTDPPSGSGGGNNHGGGGSGGSGSGGANLPGIVPPAVVPPVSTSKVTAQMKQEVAGHWAEREITEMIEDGIVTGSDTGSLELGSEVTRAEFVTMLVRALDLEAVSYNGTFADVSEDDWYADALAAANANGLLEGSDGLASPEDNITREQMAKLLVEAYRLKYGAEELPIGSIDSFSDRDGISGWAQESVAQAVGLGLMAGMDTGGFAPLESAKREQAIVVLYRLLNQ